VTEQHPIIRQADPADAEWISCFLRERWHATKVAVHEDNWESFISNSGLAS
jgi:hypothetical protein